MKNLYLSFVLFCAGYTQAQLPAFTDTIACNDQAHVYNGYHINPSWVWVPLCQSATISTNTLQVPDSLRIFRVGQNGSLELVAETDGLVSGSYHWEVSFTDETAGAAVWVKLGSSSSVAYVWAKCAEDCCPNIKGPAELCSGPGTNTFRLVTAPGTDVTWVLEGEEIGHQPDVEVMFPDSGTYQLVVLVESASCVGIDTFPIVVYPSPTIDIVGDRLACPGECITWTAVTETGNWVIWDDVYDLDEIELCDSITRSHTCWAINTFGCARSQTDTLVVVERISLERQYACLGQPLELELPKGWECTSHPDALTTIEASTMQVVTLVEPRRGCQFEIPLEVVLDPCCQDFYVPNVFSPNGDGVNDSFQIFFAEEDPKLSSFELQVFGRWGGEVFRTQSAADPWIPDENVPTGVYIWQASWVCPLGYRGFKAGEVTLVR